MSQPPANLKLYHITHQDNLPGIVQAGWLWSDAERLQQGLSCEIVGMASIKRRRVESLEVSCHPGTKVGQYVPFYFCPRSIMLYLLYRGDHPDLAYRGGQRPIVHLMADLRAVVAWANAEGRKWAFSDCNAGAGYARFFDSLDRLDEIDWEAVAACDWREAVVKEGKQAEFLVHERFPWHLVEGIGVIDAEAQRLVEAIAQDAAHKPLVKVRSAWYY